MNEIRFGTSGWRGILAEDFTFANVRRAVRAIAGVLQPRRAQSPQAPLIVGYDTRFLSPEFARETADLLSAEGYAVLFSKSFVPTPAVSFQIRRTRALGGINFTASHNPGQYNGLKFNTEDGAPAPPNVTREIERLANGPEPPAPRGPAGSVRFFDPRPPYLARLQKIVNGAALRRARLSVAVDVLYGTGAGYLDAFLEQVGCRPHTLHAWRDVTFGGHPPEPGAEQLADMVKVMRQKHCALGLGTDGDADRFGVVDADGTLLSPNEILPLVLDHLVKTRGWKGAVVRSVMTSHLVDAVAQQHRLPVQETPVGFKYIAEAMKAGDFLLGGEESGGLTIQGHIPEKDGILACLLMAEVRAIEKKSFRALLRELFSRVGPYYSRRVNFHLTDEKMQDVRRRMDTLTPNALETWAVRKIVRLDGYKFIFDDQSWLGVRLSGTEPVVRLYLETSSPAKLKALEKLGRRLIENPKA